MELHNELQRRGKHGVLRYEDRTSGPKAGAPPTRRAIAERATAARSHLDDHSFQCVLRARMLVR